MKTYELKGIKKKLQKIGVQTVYIFGSRARRQEGPLSDYDFGILLHQKLKSKKYFDIKLALIGLFSKKFKTNQIDIVILNEASPLIAMSVIKEGKILFETDKNYRVAFENYIMMTYYDRLPYEERYTEKLLERLL